MKKSTFGAAAYGGPGWQPRLNDHAQDIGDLWVDCGIDSEWRPLRHVLLHRPGPELSTSADDPNAVQMLDVVDWEAARAEHDAMAQAYRDQGVEVTLLSVDDPSPNQMFCADLFVMTPQGTILARPASRVRAGEERHVAAALAGQGVPILRTLTGDATLEGADLTWLDATTALLGMGLRTNLAAAHQVGRLFEELDLTLVPVDMPFGTMHLMGMLRIVDSDLALAWPRRTPHRAVELMRDRGMTVHFLPEHDEFDHGKAFNFVVLSPRRILVPADNPFACDFYASLGIEVVETPTRELGKAAGAVGCLTGIIARDRGG